MLDAMLKPLDVIRLSVMVDAWEPGTVATVLEIGSGSVLAEIADDDGRSLAMVTVPLDAAVALELETVAQRTQASQDVPARPGTPPVGPAATETKR